MFVLLCRFGWSNKICANCISVRLWDRRHNFPGFSTFSWRTPPRNKCWKSAILVNFKLHSSFFPVHSQCLWISFTVPHQVKAFDALHFLFYLFSCCLFLVHFKLLVHFQLHSSFIEFPLQFLSKSFPFPFIAVFSSFPVNFNNLPFPFQFHYRSLFSCFYFV